MLKISNGNLTDYQIKELIPILKGLDGKPLKDVILSFKESDYAHLVIPVLINSTNIIDEWDNPGISFNSQNTIFILYARSSDIDLLATALNQSRNGTIKEVALSSLEKIGSPTAADIIVKWAIEKKSASDFDVISILENLGHEKILCVEIKKTKKLFYLRTNSQNNFNIGKEIEIYIDINKILFFDPNNNNLIEG